MPTLTGNAIIADQNWVDRVTAVLTASSEVNSLPIQNVTDPVVVKRWRTDGAIDATVVVDFGAILETQLLFVGGTNLRQSDTIRHRLDASAAGIGSLYDAEPFAYVQDGYFCHVHILDEAVNARFWQLDFSAPSLAALSYIEAGRLWAGPIIQPGRNIDIGFSRAWDDGSRITVAEQSRAEYVDAGARQRKWELTFSLLSASESNQLEDLQRRAGTSKQIVVVRNPSAEPEQLAREVLLGRAEETSPLVHSAHPIYARPIRIRESI